MTFRQKRKYVISFSLRKNGKRYLAGAGGRNYAFRSKEEAKGYLANPIVREGKINPRIARKKE
jgi:hypothetical protein